MNTSVLEVRATDVRVTDDTLTLDLSDRRSISVPLDWYPRLAGGSPVERGIWGFLGAGTGIHWPYLNEDIRTEALLQGLPSREGAKSLQKWHDRRSMLREKYRLLDSLKSKCGHSLAPLEHYELHAAYYKPIEGQLRQLQPADLNSLQQEIAQLPDPVNAPSRRGFLDRLAEVEGYVYLINQYGTAQFIPRSKKSGEKTPDLESVRDGRLLAVLEIKRIWRSVTESQYLDDVERRLIAGQPPRVLRVTPGLSDKLREKLVSTVNNAVSQLTAYSTDPNCNRIVYLIAQLDFGARDTPDIEALLREAVVPVLGDCELVLKIIP